MSLTGSFRSRCSLLVSVLLLSATLAAPVVAQTAQTTMLDYSTGSEFEEYLRALQVAGLTELYPWSIRGFSPREIRRLVAADTAGPWKLAAGTRMGRLAAGPLTLRVTFNSSYPYGANDGPVWAGRGLTTAMSGGVSGSAGPFSFTLAPLAFRAGNASFDLLDNGGSGQQRFAHGTSPGIVDLPQRFGDRPYSRVDPGASTVRFDSRFVTFGASTANGWIGPATEYPFLLSTNAPGFPHLFAGTGQPLNLWIARIHSRLAWGKLSQSDYSPVTGSTRYTSASPGTVRLATYGSVVIIPRGIPGLEVGVARFFHVPYTAAEPSGNFWKKPFTVLFQKTHFARGDSLGLDNQLASIFFRWVFPGGGVELYGERGYEDQIYDTRDFIQDPDHEREYMLGIQKAITRRENRLDVFKLELVNYQLPTLARVRAEGLVYVHGQLPQGHTNRGQLLGASPGVLAAAASTISWTRYAQATRTTATLRRIVRADRGDYFNTGVTDPYGSDVIVGAGLDRLRFGRVVDVGAHVEIMQNFNRDFVRDVPNLNLQLTLRW